MYMRMYEEMICYSRFFNLKRFRFFFIVYNTCGLIDRLFIEGSYWE